MLDLQTYRCPTGRPARSGRAHPAPAAARRRRPTAAVAGARRRSRTSSVHRPRSSVTAAPSWVAPLVTASSIPAVRMTAEERERYEHDGFLVRTGVFSSAELDDLRRAVEDVAATVKARAMRDGSGPEARLADGHRIQFSSRAAIQWEWREGSEAIRLIEPVAHLDPRLAGLFADDRLIHPMHDALNIDDVGPFTSKLNLKHAEEGSEFPYHQDYPYWYVVVEEHAADIATAIVFLDDARAGNGALRVLPRIASTRPCSAPSRRPDPVPRRPRPPQLRGRGHGGGSRGLGAAVRVAARPPVVAQRERRRPAGAPALVPTRRPPTVPRASVPGRAGGATAVTSTYS